MQHSEAVKAAVEKGFQFPGEFEITAVGSAAADLQARVPQILEALGLHVLHETVRQRHSREKKFLSVTITIRCEDRQQYETAHAALRAVSDIHYTL